VSARDTPRCRAYPRDLTSQTAPVHAAFRHGPACRSGNRHERASGRRRGCGTAPAGPRHWARGPLSGTMGATADPAPACGAACTVI